MRLATIAAALMLAAGPAWATECRLSTRDCVTVEQELAIESAARARDWNALYNFDLLQRKMAVIERSSTRLQARVRRLPTLIGNEFARIMRCDAGDRLAALDGKMNADPQCR